MKDRYRKKLKEMAKELQEVRSANNKRFVESLNPVSIDHPDWARNEIVLRQRERELRQHRRIIPANEATRAFAIEAIDGAYQANDFIVCLRCGDFLPFFSQVALTCSCGHLQLDPADRPPYNTFVDIELARLTPRIPTKPWWKLWG